jgi:hypothetical protein
MANIEIRASLHDRDAIRGLEELGKVGRTGIARALKRTGISERVQLARDVSKDIGLGVEAVKREISTRVDVDGGSVTIATAGFRIPLIRFKARGPQPSKGRKGSGVSALRFGTRQKYEGAFIATVGGQHTGVFRRVGISTRKSVGAWSKNLPIKQLYGPSIATVFGKHLPAAVDRGVEVLGKNLQHELQFALAQVNR